MGRKRWRLGPRVLPSCSAGCGARPPTHFLGPTFVPPPG